MENALVRSPRTRLDPARKLLDRSLEGCASKQDRRGDVDYRPWTAPHGVTKTFLGGSAAVFIRKPLINLGYLVRFLEIFGKKSKLSEGLTELF
jgi:hypothetical protein